MNKASILIIKPDHIGDYILFRNFLTEIKQSEKFQNYKLVLFLNTRVKEIAEFLDSDIVDQFIWVDLENFVKAGWYFQRKIQEVTLNSYDVVINAMFAYMKPIEILISQIKSKQKILIKGSSTERALAYAENDSSIYSEIIDLSEKQLFEFERFKVAFESIINKNITLNRPYLSKLDSWQDNLLFENDFCVLFIGADADYRKWPLSHYRKVIQNLLQSCDIDIIIIGGKEEIEDAQQLSLNFATTKLINLVGETTLLDVMSILSKAKFVISNETGAAHISIILNTPTLVISNGNHFGKFTPYPTKYETLSKTIYPFKINDNFTYEDCVEKYYDGSRLDIHLIDTDSVITLIDLICEEYNIIKYQNKHINKTIEDKNINIFSPIQSRLNYNFSAMFSGVYLNLIEIKKSSDKIVIYGNGYFGKIVKNILEDSAIGIIDKSSLMESTSPNSFDVFAPQTLNHFKYDKILISVLGRENEIIDFLNKECNIFMDKIIILRITQGRYQIGC